MVSDCIIPTIPAFRKMLAGGIFNAFADKYGDLGICYNCGYPELCASLKKRACRKARPFRLV